MYFPLTSRPRLLLPFSFPHPLPRPLLFLLQEVHWTDLQERASIRVLSRLHSLKGGRFKKTTTSFAELVVQAQTEKKKRDLRWRGPKEVYARRAIAWGINLTLNLIALTMAVIYAGKFGERQTQKMCVSWLVAYGWTFAIVEPFQVLVLAGAPCLFDEETRMGRCCGRARFVYNELFAP